MKFRTPQKIEENRVYVTGKQRAGHPEWFSPITGKLFVTSNHLSHEVANGTLKSI